MSLGNLLAWGLENSHPDDSGQAKTKLVKKNTVLSLKGQSADSLCAAALQDPAQLAQLLGNQKSDATVMKEAMEVILDPGADEPDKETAFDNFEMLIQQLDNANNMEALGLWPPLMTLLAASPEHLRLMAAWCCGTAVQNNAKSQAALHANGGVPRLLQLALADPAPAVRKKAVYALSCAVRNFQPALQQLLADVPDDMIAGHGTLRTTRADDMEAIDELMKRLRERAAR